MCVYAMHNTIVVVIIIITIMIIIIIIITIIEFVTVLWDREESPGQKCNMTARASPTFADCPKLFDLIVIHC